MSIAPFLLSESEAESIASALQLFLVTYQALAHNDEQRRCPQHLWKIRPKFLYLDIIACEIRTTRLNPRYQSCADDEDYLGKVKKVTCRTHARTFMWRSLQRIVLGWSMRWERRRRIGGFRL